MWNVLVWVFIVLAILLVLFSVAPTTVGDVIEAIVEGILDSFDDWD